MAEEHPLDKLLPKGKVIDDRYAIIEPLENQGSYSRMYWVENKRLGCRDLMKVNLSAEMARPDVSLRAQKGLLQIKPGARSSNEALLLSLVGGSTVPTVRDLVSLPQGLSAVVYATGPMNPLPTWERPWPWWRSGWVAPANPYSVWDDRNPLRDAEMLLATMMMPAELKRALHVKYQYGDFMSDNAGLMLPLRAHPLGFLGIIHNDLKPGNILVNPSFYVGRNPHVPGDNPPYLVEYSTNPFCIIDWGLAVPDDDVVSGSAAALYAQGANFEGYLGVFGSASYSDPRSFFPWGEFPLSSHDSWSIGAICYELFTGRSFRNEDFQRVVHENVMRPARMQDAVRSILLDRQHDMIEEQRAMHLGMLKLLIGTSFDQPAKGAWLEAADCAAGAGALTSLELQVLGVLNVALEAPEARTYQCYAPRRLLWATERLSRLMRQYVGWAARERGNVIDNNLSRSLLPLYRDVFCKEIQNCRPLFETDFDRKPGDSFVCYPSMLKRYAEQPLPVEGP